MKSYSIAFAIFVIYATLLYDFIEPRPIPTNGKDRSEERKCHLKGMHQEDHLRPPLSKIRSCEGDDIR
uniref:Uncharacterized protein n=1 Tax=Acrobeloides nanus TaxID=290746 RepID=A0A914DK23_9BILA